MSLTQDAVVIAGAVRTPMGGFQGALASQSATELGATVIRAAAERGGVAPAEVDEVLMGCVLPAGLGQAPARQAAIGGGLPASVHTTTLNKVCGSGMKAVMTAADGIRAGSADVVIAGGMESMSNAPYLLAKARRGYRQGHGQLIDHMFLDGLEDAYDRGRSMGTFAEDTAAQYQFGRAEQDDFALASLRRAKAAISGGRFSDETVAIDSVADDEQPGLAKEEKIPQLRTPFRENGTVTAASSASISDGAAAMVLTRLGQADQRGMSPMAVLHGHASHAGEPAWFTTAPVFAIRKLLEKLDWPVSSVDLFEINEAFAVVPMVAMRELGIPHDRLNVNGGACALGHPLGCSGARIIVTLIHALKQSGGRRGVAAVCIGGGEATAVGIELI
jgi:acetyl-CoA C-acetyltransferase